MMYRPSGGNRRVRIRYTYTVHPEETGAYGSERLLQEHEVSLIVLLEILVTALTRHARHLYHAQRVFY